MKAFVQTHALTNARFNLNARALLSSIVKHGGRADDVLAALGAQPQRGRRRGHERVRTICAYAAMRARHEQQQLLANDVQKAHAALLHHRRRRRLLCGGSSGRWRQQRRRQQQRRRRMQRHSLCKRRRRQRRQHRRRRLRLLWRSTAERQVRQIRRQQQHALRRRQLRRLRKLLRRLPRRQRLCCLASARRRRWSHRRTVLTRRLRARRPCCRPGWLHRRRRRRRPCRRPRRRRRRGLRRGWWGRNCCMSASCACAATITRWRRLRRSLTIRRDISAASSVFCDLLCRFRYNAAACARAFRRPGSSRTAAALLFVFALGRRCFRRLLRLLLRQQRHHGSVRGCFARRQPRQHGRHSILQLLAARVCDPTCRRGQVCSARSVRLRRVGGRFVDQARYGDNSRSVNLRICCVRAHGVHDRLHSVDCACTCRHCCVRGQE
jgi:hypothetical protein